MPKKAYLAPHLEAAQLKQRYQTCPEPVASRRWHLLWLVATDWSIKQAALAVGISYDYAKAIVSHYNQDGEMAVTNRRQTRHSGGKPALLNEAQLAQLRQALSRPPDDGGLWSGPKVARWIAQQTGQKVWAQRGWDYLKRCRFSPPETSSLSC